MKLLGWLKSSKKSNKSDAVPLPAPAERKAEPKAAEPETVDEAYIARICSAAVSKDVNFDEVIAADLSRTDSYFYIGAGSAELAPVRAVLRRGDCIGPLRFPGAMASAMRALETSTVFEIKQPVFKKFPLSAQVWILNSLNRTTCRVMQEAMSGSMDAIECASKLSAYSLEQAAKQNKLLTSRAISKFLSDMPQLPVHALNLAEKLMSEDVSVREVVESIKTDPAMAAIVLRAVNSAQYGFEKKIETFYRACVILGFDNIYALLMREAVESSVHRSEESRGIHVHSCLVSAVANEIAALASEDLRACTTLSLLHGLLHDAGRSVLALLKHEYPAFNGAFDIMDHARIGADLLKRWNLPERIWRVVEFQDYPRFAPPEAIPVEFRYDVAVLHLAHLCSDLMVGEEPQPTGAYLPEYLDLLHLPTQSVEETHRMIMPALARKQASLPLAVRRLIGLEPDSVISKPQMKLSEVQLRS